MNNRGSAVCPSTNTSVYVYDSITLMSHTHPGLLQCRNHNQLYSVFPVGLGHLFSSLSVYQPKKIGADYDHKFLSNQVLIFQDGCFWTVASPIRQ